MSSNPQRLQYLFQQYLHNRETSDELKEFWKLFAELDEKDDPIKNELWQLWYTSDVQNQSGNKDWENTLERIHVQAKEWEQKSVPVFLRVPFRRAAAVVITLMLGTAAYFLFPHKRSKEIVKTETQQTFKNDLPAGTNKAVLTLSNGTSIILNRVPEGKLAQQGNTKILKLAAGQLSYKNEVIPSPGTDKIEPVQYNILTTPRGGQYQVILPDGTIVWLNSASSIRYPTAFHEKDRKVEITGEAYFEVAHKANQPFKVIVNGMTVEVLGTHFNINAYIDEPVMRTTLLEGSIKLSTRLKEQVLSPGQQMEVQPNGQTKLIKEVDTEQAVAWKNGKFSFHKTSIYEVMRQISRWYDVDVNYQEPFDVYLNGMIQKNVNVSQVFKMIELTGEAKFKIEGRKITVMK